MKEYIKFVNDNYHEVLKVDDEAALNDGVEIVIPDGFLELLPLDDGTPPTEKHTCVKLIIQDDKVYYKFLEKQEETSSGNVRIVRTTEFFFINLEDDTITPTQEIQQCTKEILQALTAEETYDSLDKARSLFQQSLEAEGNI